MHQALWVSKTGLTAQDQRLGVISNNLANVSTTAFKKDRIIFNDLMYQIKKEPGGASSADTELPSGLLVGTGVRTVATQKIHTAGSIEVTDVSTDVAIVGRGFFRVLLPDGEPAYTRDGSFQLNSDGEVVTAAGMPLDPPLAIDDRYRSVTVGRDGTVSATDSTTGDTVQIGNIDIVDFLNPAGLLSLGDNLFQATESSGDETVGTPSEDGFGYLVQGSLEMSNVNVVEEMVNMISTQRAYEMNSKVVSTADQMLQFLNQNV